MKAFILITFILLTGCNYQTFPDDCESIQGLIVERCLPSDIQRFSSFGGLIDEGLFILDNSKTVVANHICNSMCAIILINAPVRQLCEGTSLGFHKATNKKGTDLIINRTKENKRINFDYFYSIMANTPNSSIYFVNAEEALSAGFIDEIIKCDPWF